MKRPTPDEGAWSREKLIVLQQGLKELIRRPMRTTRDRVLRVFDRELLALATTALKLPSTPDGNFLRNITQVLHVGLLQELRAKIARRRL